MKDRLELVFFTCATAISAPAADCFIGPESDLGPIPPVPWDVVMEIRPLYLISYFIAAAYLLAWLARFILNFIQWSRKAGLSRLLVGQRIFLNPLRSILPWNSIFLVVSGGILGWSVISWVEAWFVREWLLLILPGLAILKS